MIVYWSKRAISQLDRIAEYIEKDNPAAAERLATFIFNEVKLFFHARAWQTSDEFRRQGNGSFCHTPTSLFTA